MNKRAFVALTGASGAIYGLSIIKALNNVGLEIYACATKNALKNAEKEFGKTYSNAHELFAGLGVKDSNIFEESETDALPASGSFKIDYYIIAPASMGFIGRAAAGISSNLIERAADVALKERRQLIILFREMPLSSIHLENMLKLSNNGSVIIPASPGFYANPKTIDDLINFTTGKVLDIMNIENDLYKRWRD